MPCHPSTPLRQTYTHESDCNFFLSLLKPLLSPCTSSRPRIHVSIHQSRSKIFSPTTRSQPQPLPPYSTLPEALHNYIWNPQVVALRRYTGQELKNSNSCGQCVVEESTLPGSMGFGSMGKMARLWNKREEEEIGGGRYFERSEA